MSAVLVTNCDDWEGLYVNGKLVAQDHNLSWKVLRSVKGMLYEQEIDSEYTYSVGILPDNYSDIPYGAFTSEPVEVRVSDE